MLFSEVGCNFVRGDGTGGSEQYIGRMSTKNECIDACVAKMKAGEKEINGVTMSATVSGGKYSCYCESKMTGPNTSTSWQTCKMDFSKMKGNKCFLITFYLIFKKGKIIQMI